MDTITKQLQENANAPELHVSPEIRSAALNAALRYADIRLCRLHDRAKNTDNTREFARVVLESYQYAKDMFAFEDEAMTMLTPILGHTNEALNA